jgi:hypothetical protein
MNREQTNDNQIPFDEFSNMMGKCHEVCALARAVVDRLGDVGDEMVEAEEKIVDARWLLWIIIERTEQVCNFLDSGTVRYIHRPTAEGAHGEVRP